MSSPGSRVDGGFKAVIFDFGNVLCRLDRLALGRVFARHCPLDAEEIGARIWGGDIESDAETGRMDSHSQYRRVREVLAAEPSWSYEDFARDYMSCILPNPDGEAALVAVAAAGIRTFVLSNTSFLHARAIFLNETLATIPEIHALSYKLGFMKPDPRCWLWILERASLEPRDCVYVDDVERYCEVAAGLGIRSIRYDPETENLLHKLEGVL